MSLVDDAGGLFGRWLRRRLTAVHTGVATWVAIAVSAGGVVYNTGTAVLAWLNKQPGGAEPYLAFSMYTAQAAILILLICILPDARLNKPSKMQVERTEIPEEEAALTLDSDRVGRALQATSDFRSSFKRLLWAWAILYLVFAATEIPTLFGQASPLAGDTVKTWGSLFKNFANNLSSYFVFSCYVSLSDYTVESTDQEQEKVRRRSERKRDLARVLLAVLTVLEIAASVWVSALKDGAPALAVKGQFAMGWVSGFAAAVALCLLFGRLESKNLGTNAVVTSLLYAYAAIQPAWQPFTTSADNGMALVMTSFALALKVLLFLFVTWSLEEGWLQFYMYRTRLLMDTVTQRFQQFKQQVF